MTKNEIYAITENLSSYAAYGKMNEARFDAIENGTEKEWKENEYENWFKAVARIGGVAIQGDCDTDWFIDCGDDAPPKEMVEDFAEDLKKGIKWLEEVDAASYNIFRFNEALNITEEYLASL